MLAAVLRAADGKTYMWRRERRGNGSLPGYRRGPGEQCSSMHTYTGKAYVYLSIR